MKKKVILSITLFGRGDTLYLSYFNKQIVRKTMRANENDEKFAF